jgi:creatinine amidohydrolase
LGHIGDWADLTAPKFAELDRAGNAGSAHLERQQSHRDLGLGGAPLRPGWLIADMNPDGAIGNAAAATAGKGAALLTTAARNLARLIGDFVRFSPG